MIGPYEVNSIVTGNARELAKDIPDDSIDLVFCDPVYENVADYEWLGELAMRVLHPNKACLAWIKTTMHDECKAALVRAGLRYQYTLFYTVSAKPAKPRGCGIFPWTTPCLLMSKGGLKAERHLPDTYFSPYAPHSDFKWQKNENVIERWMESFSKVGDIVCDPFTGMGVVPVVAKKIQRQFIGFEIDADRAVLARERVLRGSVLLPFTPSMEQAILLET